MRFFKYKIIIIIGLFIIKLISALFLIEMAKCLNPETFQGIASMSGDAPSYITPIDNYIEKGDYIFQTTRAGRMPYLGLVYYPFRLLFSKPIALSILVILQILLEAIAIFFMAKLCSNLFKNNAAFWIFIFLSTISLYVSIFNYYVLTESFGISFICLFSYNYYNYLSNNRTNKQLIIAGIFLALAILFKPYLSFLYLFIGTEFLWHYRYIKIFFYTKKVIISTFLISIPLIIINTPWTIRNYNLTKKFIPFQEDLNAGYNYSQATLAVRIFCKTIGESFISWDKRSAGCYFESQESLPCEFTFPERIFSDNLTIPKIEDAKEMYLEFQRHPSDSLEKLTIQKFNVLSETYKKDHTFSYYFITPIILCKNFLLHSGSYYLPIKKESFCYHTYQWILKLSQSLLYYLALIAGCIGLGLLLRKNPKSLILFSIPIYLIALFPLYFRATEFRYFHLAYPFLMIGLINIMLLLKKRLTSF